MNGSLNAEIEVWEGEGGALPCPPRAASMYGTASMRRTASMAGTASQTEWALRNSPHQPGRQRKQRPNQLQNAAYCDPDDPEWKQ